MRSLIIAATLAFSTQAQAQLAPTPGPAPGNDFTGKAMVIARIAGLCEGLKQVQVFQEAAKLDGGDAFARQFLAAEAKRLGKTLEQLNTQCGQAERTYQQLAQMVGIEG